MAALIQWSDSSNIGDSHVKQLKYLLTVRKLDIMGRDNRGRIVLLWAAELGAAKAVDLLLKSPRTKSTTRPYFRTREIPPIDDNHYRDYRGLLSMGIMVR